MAKVHSPPSLLAVRIREARIAQGLTQQAIAELIGVKQQNTISSWERGRQPGKENLEAYEKMIELLEIEHTQPEEPPRVERPVPVTKSLRVALSTPEDEFAYSPRKIHHSIQYLLEIIPQLLQRLEKSAAEIHRLEQAQGITAEQLALLRQKAGDFDKMQELLGRKMP